ncbi:MAG: hypothetical protein MPF33_02770 [Candidatus Aramenus sp.]|nr:hypothetical protein [Candidatus Aramenus sp.]
MNPSYLYLGFSLSIALSLVNRKAGYYASATVSLLSVYYGALVGGVDGDFLAIVGVVWFLASVYSTVYDNYGRWLSPLLITSMLGMAISLTARTYLEFLAGWEIMTIPMYAIVGVNRRQDFPAFSFMAFGELSTALLLAGFVYAYSFTDSPYFTALQTTVPLVLVALGSTFKMATFPFMASEWVPIAQANAPANASALISAGTTLVATYILARVALLSPITPALGFVLMVVGSTSVFFGALYAYVSEHLKGLLAFSTAENDGALLSLVGLYLTYQTKTLANFALDVLVVYSLAHSIAKTGLFMVAGSVEGESLSRLKVVRSRLGKVGAVLLTSSMSGLLPNVGGVAVWGLLEGLFMEAFLLHSALSAVPIISGAVIAMGEGFASGAMVKFLSYTQLFRGERGRSARLLVSSVVGVAVLLLGPASYVFFKGFLTGAPQLGIAEGLVVSSEYLPGKVFGGISPLYVFLLVVAFSVVTLGVFGRPKVRRSSPWNNGVKPREEYTALAFANNVRLMLAKLLRTKIDEIVVTSDVFWRAFYLVARKYLVFSRALARAYMNSSISWYIAYMVVAFILVTLVVVLR